jgi:hypothetical protein
MQCGGCVIMRQKKAVIYILKKVCKTAATSLRIKVWAFERDWLIDCVNMQLCSDSRSNYFKRQTISSLN